MAGPERGGEALAGLPDRPEEPGPVGHLRRLRRWADGVPRGDPHRFAEKWDSKYPTISKQWRLRWADICAMFEFPPEIRKAIYTTNAIESVNSAIRKYTRNRKLYP